MSGDDGLREAIDRALFRSGADNYDMALDLVLALPEVAALRAKAAAADRVREMLPQLDAELDEYGYALRNGLRPSPADRIRRALDGPQPC